MTPKETLRAYQQSHPWIDFHFNMNGLDHSIWLLLGEAKSKCDHIKGAPLLPETIQKMFNVYLAKGASATTAIEGNTLTEEEVERRIKGQLELPLSKEYLGIEIDNIVKAYNLIGKKSLTQEEPVVLSVEEIKEYNRLVLENLPLGEGVVPGKIRTYSVGIADYRGAPAEDCEFLLREYVKWLNDEFRFTGDRKVVFGILKAVLAHLYFVWIHPFGDGNGRTARLIEFQILISVGVPAVAAHLLSNHYNATRTEYYRQLRLTSKSKSHVNDFIGYALQGFVDGLKAEIDSIQVQQMKVHWINHIYNTFSGKNLLTDKRQRDLLLELSIQITESRPFSEIRHATPKIAEMYAGKSDLTLKRDLQDLRELGLLAADGDNYTLNISVLNIYRTPARG
jgi:Fic family protein